jgi:hypothetical protein
VALRVLILRCSNNTSQEFQRDVAKYMAVRQVLLFGITFTLLNSPQPSKHYSTLRCGELREYIRYNLSWRCDPQFFKRRYSEIEHRFDTVSTICGAALRITLRSCIPICLHCMYNTSHSLVHIHFSQNAEFEV